MDRDLERIMEHEKRLAARVKEAEEAAVREVDLRCREAADNISARRDAAIGEWENRFTEQMSGERSRQEEMTRDLENELSRMENDGELCHQAEEIIIGRILSRGDET